LILAVSQLQTDEVEVTKYVTRRVF